MEAEVETVVGVGEEETRSSRLPYSPAALLVSLRRIHLQPQQSEYQRTSLLHPNHFRSEVGAGIKLPSRASPLLCHSRRRHRRRRRRRRVLSRTR